MRGHRILGLDPGSSRLGYGVIELVADEPRLMHYGCIETTPNLALPEKLSALFAELTERISAIKPDIIGIEMIFFAANAKSAFDVGQARGIALLAGAMANIPIVEIAPLSLKKILLGNGGSATAKKRDIQHFVKHYFNLQSIPKPDDAADAVAIALCCVFNNKILERSKL